VISGRTALFGVLGSPVGHSLSPAMQNAAFAAAGVDAVYVALPAPPERLAEAVRGAHALGFQGLNVTVPHKQAAAALCERLAPSAAAVGAVNTLVRRGGGWEGHNTDAPALRDLLAAAGASRGARALVLGAGGAARAAAWALLEIGAAVRVAARRPEAAEALCRDLAAGRPAAPEPAPWSRVADEAQRAEVVVNATSAGLGGADLLPPLPLRGGQVACDLVYGDTAFARAAAAAGARVVTGERVLVRQGALAFQLWLGREAPEQVMAAALGRAGER